MVGDILVHDKGVAHCERPFIPVEMPASRGHHGHALPLGMFRACITKGTAFAYQVLCHLRREAFPGGNEHFGYDITRRDRMDETQFAVVYPASMNGLRYRRAQVA
ncbi:hypothetical protein DDE01_13920 [Desulfovibrio desulfuricans]|nr:hypothetical protein DDE01_13920 [Desulfovibrio desulfuricans]